MNQQPPMYQLAVLFIGWVAFFHLVSNEVHHNPFFFATDHCIFFFWFVLGCFFPGPDLTHSYPTHLPTLISIVSTLVFY
jgi:hypothetical protein